MAANCIYLDYGWLKKGYRYIKVDGRDVRAIKYFYEKRYGIVPDGFVLDHVVCNDTECCNPDHVMISSQAENTQRGLQAKLNWQQVNEIRESKSTQKELAKKYGVRQTSISNIKTYKTWIP